MKGQVSSLTNWIDTLTVFAGDSCTGDSLRISLGPIDFLDSEGFDDRIRSVLVGVVTEDCEPGSDDLCLYAFPNMEGERQMLTPQPEGTCVNVQPSLTGEVSSISNWTDQRVYLYINDDCTGDGKFMDSGLGYPNLAVQGIDNRERSVKFGPIWSPNGRASKPGSH